MTNPDTTMSIRIGLDLNVEAMLMVNYTYERGYDATHYEPEEPDHLEIDEIKVYAFRVFDATTNQLIGQLIPTQSQALNLTRIIWRDHMAEVEQHILREVSA